MVDAASRMAGLMHLMKAQSAQLAGQCEALCNGEGLTLSKEQKGDFVLEDAIKELQSYQSDHVMSQEEFQSAHKRIQEIAYKVKQIVASLSADQQKKYEKKAEKKVNKVVLNNRDKLQKQLDEITAKMPEQQKLGLKQMMDRMPPQRQEQLIAELMAQFKKREAMSEEERKAEDQEMMVLQTRFN